MAAATVFLKDAKLRQLAQLIRNHEVNNIYHITFKNLGDKHQYLRMCDENMASVSTILDECNAVSMRYKCDSVRGPIAKQILVYMEHCLNNVLQVVRNYTMRRSYLDKMTDHLHQLFKALEDLDASSQDAVADLIDSIKKFDQMVMAYMQLNLNSYVSAEFSRYLKNSGKGIGFAELVRRYQAKLGYAGKFEDLEDEKKFEVYAAIIEASGRLSVLAKKHEGDVLSSITYAGKKYGGPLALSRNRRGADAGGMKKQGGGGKIAKYGSAAMFMKDVGRIVWDVYSSDRPITTALRDALVLAASNGGSTLGKLVGVALATEFLSGVAAPALLFTAVGLATGIVGAFVLEAAAGALFDLIVSSGGDKPFPTDGFVVYVAPMPNGHDLAKQIAYN